MAEPFQDLGRFGLVRARVAGGRGAQRVHAEVVYPSPDAGLKTVFQDYVAVDRVGLSGRSNSWCGYFVTGRNTGPAAARYLNAAVIP